MPPLLFPKMEADRRDSFEETAVEDQPMLPNISEVSLGGSPELKMGLKLLPFTQVYCLKMVSRDHTLNCGHGSED